MKILYAFQGTGNGHASRAIEIIPYLKEIADVDVLTSGYQCELALPFEVKYKYYGLSFIFGKNGGINIWQTIKQAKISNLFKEINAVPLAQYDLIINDFEPITSWAAKLKNSPIISLSHQSAVLDKNAPKYGKFRFERLILKYYAPIKTKFGFHFKAYSSDIFTPIIRKKIRNTPIVNKGHYTVYLPAYSDKKILKVLSKIENIKWEVFSKHTQKNIIKNNIIIKPINGDSFIKSISSSKGVMCGAGFETPAEALFLQKKLLVIPMKNQYEQQCNAIALKEMGIPVLKTFNKKQVAKITHWVHTQQNSKVNYPDTTKNILETIISPYYRQVDFPIATTIL
ncbi:glycosyltransferase family protein [Tenacibaculum finnmarkense]|uniref:Glycosyl transferase n=3 Tax=Tenacibaculum finnmarkense TaxID=2781243 RepID=A0A2I2M9D0_9FLAO|nr:glycosyltransferase family protein [Tenacibaculum finnmarkense]ALU75205.1 glycosyl transferase [Tenacibaculum dicentrarchi]MBE7646591.1 glycosyl transferase [Tenacibaculum finnmarkense genomovar ulcerans]MBE7648845.1 glycosyl transferase [Tenacibaculum finnmarkense genomovar ulcerans]MBE7698543.1 glycosyl transferase [Tenacibaculum finnmarkense genomovar ulcerans]MCD8400967.1 glycosyl transferase [Tenacibaculum finnmarkense genomovar ulcerans]